MTDDQLTEWAAKVSSRLITDLAELLPWLWAAEMERRKLAA